MESVKNDVHFTMLKGEPATRKSTHALTYPRPQYWFSFDHKMNALSLPMNLWNIPQKEIHFDDYTDWDATRTKLESFCALGLDASAHSMPYKTIILDSITSAADYMLRQVRKSKSGTTKKSGAEGVRKIGGIDVGDIEDYRAENSGFGEMIALLKLIKKIHNIDIILIAHVIRTEQKTLDGITNVSRMIVTEGKKPAARIPAYCDEIYHFGHESSIDATKIGSFVIHTQSSSEDFARTTLDLPVKIDLEGRKLYDDVIKPAIIKQQTK